MVHSDPFLVPIEQDHGVTSGVHCFALAGRFPLNIRRLRRVVVVQVVVNSVVVSASVISGNAVVVIGQVLVVPFHSHLLALNFQLRRTKRNCNLLVKLNWPVDNRAVTFPSGNVSAGLIVTTVIRAYFMIIVYFTVHAIINSLCV